MGVRERLAETVGRQLGAAVCGGRKAAFFRERLLVSVCDHSPCVNNHSPSMLGVWSEYAIRQAMPLDKPPCARLPF